MTLCLQYSLFTYNTTILLGDFFIDDLHNRTCTSIHSTYTHTRANRRSYFTSVEVRRLVNQQTIERKIRPDLPRSGRSGRKGMAKRRQKRSVNNEEERNDPLFFRTSIHFLPIPFLPSSLFPSLYLPPLQRPQLGVNYVSATYWCFRREWKLRPRVSKRRRAEGNKINCST